MNRRGAIFGKLIEISGFARSIVGAVTGHEVDALLPLLDEAVALGLVRESAPARYEFTHPILRATVLEKNIVRRCIWKWNPASLPPEER